MGDKGCSARDNKKDKVLLLFWLDAHYSGILVVNKLLEPQKIVLFQKK